MADINVEFELQMKMYLEILRGEVEKLFKESIQKVIYDSYQPTQYVRTNTFLDSVKAIINPEGNIFVSTDLNESSGYTSAVDGSPQYSNINLFLEFGHDDKSGIGGMYHNHPATNFLEKAKELIQDEHPELSIEIII